MPSRSRLYNEGWHPVGTTGDKLLISDIIRRGAVSVLGSDQGRRSARDARRSMCEMSHLALGLPGPAAGDSDPISLNQSISAAARNSVVAATTSA